jgi:hypothetical protein
LSCDPEARRRSGPEEEEEVEEEEEEEEEGYDVNERHLIQSSWPSKEMAWVNCRDQLRHSLLDEDIERAQLTTPFVRVQSCIRRSVHPIANTGAEAIRG